MSDAKPTMTWSEVAELLHHPEPHSRAAREKVRRLEQRGLPRVPHLEPAVYMRDQVLEYLARSAAADAPAPPPAKASSQPRSGGKKRPAAVESPIQAAMRELRREMLG
jgi:hypothetical protein